MLAAKGLPMGWDEMSFESRRIRLPYWHFGGTWSRLNSPDGRAALASAHAATISPSAQLGYYQRLSDSRWLLGGKLTYNYIAATATNKADLLPTPAMQAATAPTSVYKPPTFACPFRCAAIRSKCRNIASKNGASA